MNSITREMRCRAVVLGALMACATFVLGGCRTTDAMYRKTVSVVDPDKTMLQGGVRWMNPQPSLRPVSPDKMVVYLRFKNTSGSPLPNLQSQIKSAFEAAGYRVTRDPNEAQFVVTADARYFGENRSKDAGGSMLAGAVFGAIPGAIIGNNLGRGGNAAAGAAAGAVLGAAIGNIMANRNKMIEYDLVVDLRIGERVRGGVRTVRKASESSRVSHADAAGAEAGRASGGSSEEQRAEVREDFLYHQNRLVGHVTRMALTPEEAVPFLEKRIVAAVGSILP
ncbi:MAG: hypothetical protein GXP31_01555 [Kiritimatiellaeota bacterium]|nr:hypothetical protein [Kiritimatiellota bacterium]